MKTKKPKKQEIRSDPRLRQNQYEFFPMTPRCQCGCLPILHTTFAGDGGKLEDQFKPSGCMMCRDCKGFKSDYENQREKLLTLCESDCVL